MRSPRITGSSSCGARAALVALFLLPACSFAFGVGKLGPPAEDAPPHAGPEEAAAAEAGASYCARANPVPIFCGDFDEGDVRAGWANALYVPDPYTSANASIEPDLDLARSLDGTRGVAFRLPAAPSGVPVGQAQLVAVVDVVPDTSDFYASIRIDTAANPGRNSVAFMGVGYGVGSKNGMLMLTRKGSLTMLTMLDETKIFAEAQMPPITVGGWHDLRLRVDMVGGEAGTAASPRSMSTAATSARWTSRRGCGLSPGTSAWGPTAATGRSTRPA